MPPRRRSARAGAAAHADASPPPPPRRGRAPAAAKRARTSARHVSLSPPRRFYVGPAISVYQNSGDPNSNWAAWEARRAWGGLRPTTMGGLRCGSSCDFWNRYRDDVALTAAIGSNALRLSLEWSRIVPSEGVVDRTALARYASIFRACRAAGITPLVTLHHFVQPQWVDAGGGFDRSPEWATRHFLEFVRVAVTEFGPAIDQWCTFNEPGVLVSSGWVTGFFPPGRTLALAAAGRALLTVLRAHTAATKLIRSMAAAAPGTVLRPSIGIVHNIMPYEALPLECLRGWSPPWARAAAALGHAAWGNDAVLDYLKTGAFEWAPAGRWGARVSAQDPRPPAVDWFGLNFYGRVLLDPLLRPTAAPGELVNDFQQGVWPAGFKAALHAAAGVGAPVWVMETGLPDAGDGVRGAWARAYMRAAAEAVDEGVDLRAMMIWTLVDNFEWAFSYQARFGLFAWERDDPTSARVPRRSIGTVLGELGRLKRHVEAAWARQGRAVDAGGNAPPGVFVTAAAGARALAGGGAARHNNAVPAPARAGRAAAAAASGRRPTARRGAAKRGAPAAAAATPVARRTRARRG